MYSMTKSNILFKKKSLEIFWPFQVLKVINRDGNITQCTAVVGKRGLKGGLAAAVGLRRDDKLDFPLRL